MAASMPVAIILLSWAYFNEWVSRRPLAQAAFGMLLICMGIWLKHNTEVFNMLPIPGIKDGLKLGGEFLDDTLVPIGGGIFAAAALMRSQLLNARSLTEAKRDLPELIKRLKENQISQRFLELRQDIYPERDFDRRREIKWKIEDELRKDIKRLKRILRENGEQMDNFAND